MTRWIWTALCSLVLTGCVTDSAPAPNVGAPAVCEALRPDMPIAYHSQKDTPDTVERVRKANARFNAICR